jgi:ABC-type uncharacterized transport system permease subunit
MKLSRLTYTVGIKQKSCFKIFILFYKIPYISMIFTTRTLLGIATLIYFLAFLYGLRVLFKGYSSGKISFSLFVGLAFCLHTGALISRSIHTASIPINNFFELLATIAWCAIVLTFILEAILRTPFVTCFMVGLCGIICCVALSIQYWDYDTSLEPAFTWSTSASIHILLAVLSYGALGVLGTLSFLYLLQDYSLAHKRHNRSFSLLPSLWELNQLSTWALKFVVITMTVTVIVGSISWISAHYFLSLEKLFASWFIWIACVAIWLLQAFKQLNARKFNWACCILLILALVILWPLSKHSLFYSSHVLC